MTKAQKIEEARRVWQRASELVTQTQQALEALRERSMGEYRFPIRAPFGPGVLRIPLPLTEQEYDYIVGFLAISKEVMVRPASEQDLATQAQLERVWQAARNASRDLAEKEAAYWETAAIAQDDPACVRAEAECGGSGEAPEKEKGT